MLKFKSQTAALIAEAVSNAFPAAELTSDEIGSMLEYPPDASMGDLALPCFKLSRTLRAAPVKIADTLAESISAPIFSDVSAVNGYLNFRMNGAAFAVRVLADIAADEENYGSPKCGEGKTVVAGAAADGGVCCYSAAYH